MLGASQGEIYFTSGATESNLAIQGSVLGREAARGPVITIATEHKAVLDSCQASTGSVWT